MIGELEMLTGQPRSTTVTAVRESRLARISRDGFERLARVYPRLLTRTTRDVIDRLRDAFQRRPVVERVTTFVLVPVGDGVDIAGVAHDLRRKLATHGDTILLERQSLPHLIGDAASEQHPERSEVNRLAHYLNEVELQHRYVVYWADPLLSTWTRTCLRQADHVVLVGRGHPIVDRDGAFAEEIIGSAEGAPVDLILLHDTSTSRPTGTSAWLDRLNVRMHHHLREGNDLDLARLARRLTGNGVDLVLGGGGARGWAHVGVLRAFDEAGIPIDAIAGTSMGGLIAGANALGMTWQEIKVQASAWASPRQLFDFTLPVVSIISGNKITSMLQAVYGDIRIEDLWRGYFCVSSSLSHAQPVVHRQGLLWKAIRASISIPGFLPPIREEEELLIDGSYLNNLPTDLMRDIYHSGVLVAVNVEQPTEMRGGIDPGPAISGWSVLRHRLLPWTANVVQPSLASAIMRASTLSGAYNLSSSLQVADLAITPSVASFGTLDFGKYEAIIDAGYDAASRQLEQWQKYRELAVSHSSSPR